jgi:hypothetical protein
LVTVVDEFCCVVASGVVTVVDAAAPGAITVVVSAAGAVEDEVVVELLLTVVSLSAHARPEPAMTAHSVRIWSVGFFILRIKTASVMPPSIAAT